MKKGDISTVAEDSRFTFARKIRFAFGVVFIWIINLLNTKNNHM